MEESDYKQNEAFDTRWYERLVEDGRLDEFGPEVYYVCLYGPEPTPVIYLPQLGATSLVVSTHDPDPEVRTLALAAAALSNTN